MLLSGDTGERPRLFIKEGPHVWVMTGCESSICSEQRNLKISESMKKEVWRVVVGSWGATKGSSSHMGVAKSTIKTDIPAATSSLMLVPV